MVTLLARRGAVLTALILASLSLSIASASATPTLDMSFAGGGITPKVFPNGKWPQNAGGAVQQADGKILVPMAFSSKYGHDGERPVLRYNLDGTLDRTYGKSGAAWLRLPGEKLFGRLEIKRQADGKPLITGWVGETENGQWRHFVARLTSSGKIDKSFGHRGATKFAMERGGYSREPLNVYPLPNGKTIVAFERSRYNDVVLDFFRLDKDGRVERGYGGRGFKTIAFAPGRLFPIIGGISIVGDEATILVNPDQEVPQFPCKVIRTKITSNGGRVKSFGKNGTVTIGAASRETKTDCRGLTPLADGGVLIVGTLSFDEFDGTSAGVAYKLRADGSRDQTFGVGGRVQGPAQDDFTGIAGFPGGDFLVLGIKYDPENPERGPVGSTASVLNSQGGLTSLVAGGTIPQTKNFYQTQIDHAATGTVLLYTRYTQKGIASSRIVKFTN